MYTCSVWSLVVARLWRSGGPVGCFNWREGSGICFSQGTTHCDMVDRHWRGNLTCVSFQPGFTSCLYQVLRCFHPYVRCVDNLLFSRLCVTSSALSFLLFRFDGITHLVQWSTDERFSSGWRDRGPGFPQFWQLRWSWGQWTVLLKYWCMGYIFVVPLLMTGIHVCGPAHTESCSSLLSVTFRLFSSTSIFNFLIHHLHFYFLSFQWINSLWRGRGEWMDWITLLVTMDLNTRIRTFWGIIIVTL